MNLRGISISFENSRTGMFLEVKLRGVARARRSSEDRLEDGMLVELHRSLAPLYCEDSVDDDNGRMVASHRPSLYGNQLLTVSHERLADKHSQNLPERAITKQNNNFTQF